MDLFPPHRDAALERVAAIDPRAYARTRNALDGCVTRLGPYLTHGLVTVPEVIAAVEAKGAARQDKIVFELAWREYWHHVWRHLGDRIFGAIDPPTVSAAHYADTMPRDIVEGRCGVPAIDAAVRALYRDGYVHNHARLWVASYVVHVRKVAWQAGATWFQAHLLDGDLASNTLSWQWVAGTFSRKPYLFNNDNVARYAPTLARAGTAIDRSYEAMDALARAPEAKGAEPDAPHEGVVEPARLPSPPVPCDPLPSLAGRRVALVHPWMLRERPPCDVALGVLHTPCHARHPWSNRRWSFVLDRLRSLTDALWCGDLNELAPAMREAGSVTSTATLNPGYREQLPALCTDLSAAPRAFDDPAVLQRSFSRFWQQVSGHA